MTHTNTQPEALRLAHALSGGKLIDDSMEWADTLHAASTPASPSWKPRCSPQKKCQWCRRG